MPQPNDNNDGTGDSSVDIDVQAIERSEAVLERLFDGANDADDADAGVGDTSAQDDKIVSKKKSVGDDDDANADDDSDVDDADADDDDDADNDDADSSEDEEEDWDKDPSDSSDADDEEEFANDSAAVRQAKIKGREAKRLKAQLTERELELTNLRRERDELNARVQEIEAVNLRPDDHPEYSDLKTAVLSDVREAADLLNIPDPTLVTREFGNFMADYLLMSSKEGDERLEARTKLKGLIVDKLKLSEIPYADLDDDERRQHESVATDVLKILQRNAGKTKELQKLHTTLTERAKNGKLSVGVRSYENTVREFKPVLEAVGDLADDVIDANPHAIESIVAKLVKTSPKAAKRLEKARADVLEAIVGPRALTQAEIDKLEANGTDMKSFMAERQKAHRAKQQKLAAFFVQGLMTRSLLKEMATKLSKYEKVKDEEESEFDAVRKVTKKTAKVTTKEVRPKDRPSPLQSILGFDEDD